MNKPVGSSQLHKSKPSGTIYPVILSGGSGTRLWPVSRSAYPKQLQPLLSDNSLLQDSVLRVSGRARFGDPVIATNDEHRFIIAEQLRQIGVTPAAILIEPMARNTAPAAAAAAYFLAAHDPEALMLIMPSDHVIADPDAFERAVLAAASASDRLVTFGIVADRPETGYGYVRRGRPLDGSQVFEVTAFIEKPDRVRAEGFVAAGDYAWNSGIFLFPVRVFLREYERLHPASAATVRAAVENAAADTDFVRLEAGAFAQADNSSIDYAVMEHTKDAAMVPVSMGWSDVGAWDALWDISPKSDAHGNVEIGDVIALDSENSYFRSEHKLLAAVGVKDMIVVATPDAVMVAPKGRAQDVKKLVDRLKMDSRGETQHMAVVHRPWGTYQTLHMGDRVQVKHITVKPGGKLSLQLHHHRAEHWVVVRGTATVVCGDQDMILRENESTYIPIGTKHRLENAGSDPLHLIEVQCGGYLGEDDIVRFEDIYGRTK